jgi:hypothetical protein
MKSKKIGNPEKFDIPEECPDTSWGRKFRNTRLVFQKKDGEFEFHTYGGDERADKYIRQIKDADEYLAFDDFDYVRLYTTDNNPHADIVNASKEPVFSASFLDDQVDCYDPKMHVKKQTHDKLIICPDFTFAEWLDFDYAKMYEQIIDLKLDKDPIEKVCWRGSTNLASRKKLCDLTKKHSTLIDARNASNKKSKDYISLPDTFKKYKYLIDTQAHGFSGRLKYLLLSGRLVFMQCRYHKSFFENDLNPWVHYVPVADDFSDLTDKIKWAIKYEDECNDIIKNATDFARKTFHPENICKIWHKLLNNKSFDLKNEKKKKKQKKKKSDMPLDELFKLCEEILSWKHKLDG